MKVREMALGDCDRVAEIRVRGWQVAYRGLMPQPYLDALSLTEEVERRRALHERAVPGVENLVAERDGVVLGWACHGPHRDGELRTVDAELYAIYVHPDAYGEGAGHSLLQEAIRRCASAGHGRLYLWVLEGNTGARVFYERAGFRADGAEEPFDVDGVAVPEVRYVKELRSAQEFAPVR